jgi:hypothetical protein
VRLGPDRLAQSRRPAGISHTAKRLTAAITLASSPMGSPPPQRGSGRGVAARFGADGPPADGIRARAAAADKANGSRPRSRGVAVRYGSNPSSGVRWKHAERHSLSRGDLLANAGGWPEPCGDADPAWRAVGVAARRDASRGPGNRRARARRDDAGSGRRRRAIKVARSPSSLLPAAGAAGCHRLDAAVHIFVAGGAGGITAGRGWCRHLPPHSRRTGRRSRCRTARGRSGCAARPRWSRS